MKVVNFEIKVALLGNVSAGKTTVLNALLKDKYGEVSMRRTTAGVNYFRISASNKKATQDVAEKETKKDSSVSTEKSKEQDQKRASSPVKENEEGWFPDGEDPRSAESTLKEITEDNKNLRDSNLVQEKWFDVELDDELCEMRKDTKLVLADVPGINEAGACSKYKEYVNQKWDTFDCAIVVMDGKQGVNTEDQVFLLHLVKENTEKKKDIPVIILFNKVDDPEDKEQAELVKEARGEITRLFQKERPKHLLLRAPTFIPISAMHAFVHQSASKMSLDCFRRFFDRDLIEKLGRDQIGRRRWTKLSEEEKYQETYDIIHDADSRDSDEVLKESNFQQFLDTLREAVGGEKVQIAFIEKQIQESIRLMREWKSGSPPPGLVSHVYTKLQVLHGGRPPHQLVSELKSAFWDSYKKLADDKISSLETFGPCQVRSFETPIKQLLSFQELSEKIGWRDGDTIAIDEFKHLVRRLIGIFLQMEKKYCYKSWILETNGGSPWRLSPFDWTNIWGSILLLSFNRHFCDVFGREKLIIERQLHKAQANWLQCETVWFNYQQSKEYYSTCKAKCPYCRTNLQIVDYDVRKDSKGYGFSCAPCKIVIAAGDQRPATCVHCSNQVDKIFSPCEIRSCTNIKCGWRYGASEKWKDLASVTYCPTFGRMIPVNPAAYQKIVSINVAESLSNPDHVGYTLYQFCQFRDSLQLLPKSSMDNVPEVASAEPNLFEASKAKSPTPVGSGGVDAPSSSAASGAPAPAPSPGLRGFTGVGFGTTPISSGAPAPASSVGKLGSPVAFLAPAPAPAPTFGGRSPAFGNPQPAWMSSAPPFDGASAGTLFGSSGSSSPSPSESSPTPFGAPAAGGFGFGSTYPGFGVSLAGAPQGFEFGASRR